MKTIDFTLARIEAFSAAHGGGIAIRKAAKGYSLFKEANGQPVARLRPVGLRGEYEVLWWNGERWAPIGDLGGIILPLDEALRYIAEDPTRCFWH